MSEEDEPPPKLFAPAFWIALASGLLFVLAGAAVGFGPAWSARHKALPGAAAALTAPGARGKGAAPNTRNP